MQYQIMSHGAVMDVFVIGFIYYRNVELISPDRVANMFTEWKVEEEKCRQDRQATSDFRLRDCPPCTFEVLTQPNFLSHIQVPYNPQHAVALSFEDDFVSIP